MLCHQAVARKLSSTPFAHFLAGVVDACRGLWRLVALANDQIAQHFPQFAII